MLKTLITSDDERAARLGALAVAAIGVVACLYFAVRLAWLLVPRHEAIVPPSAVAAPASAASLSVAKWHLFGNAQGVAAPAPASNLATVLKLGLRGTLALPDPKDDRAIAIITNEQGNETSYRIGADVAPGARLAEVFADHVVIEHQGVAETLALPRPEQHAPPLPDRNQQALKSAAPAASVPSGINAKGAAPTAAAPAGAAPARLDPQEFARQIRPVFADGRIVGADISGTDPSLLSRVGLRTSDVVTAINGTPLAGVSNPQALMDQLQNASSIQVTVQRDGKPATLTLSLR